MTKVVMAPGGRHGGRGIEAGATGDLEQQAVGRESCPVVRGLAKTEIAPPASGAFASLRQTTPFNVVKRAAGGSDLAGPRIDFSRSIAAKGIHMDEMNSYTTARVVQPGEVQLMLPDEFEQRLAALERESAATRPGARQGGDFSNYSWVRESWSRLG